ncbi:NAD-dependent epimerase/dehydratase family protein [Mucilaginibacter psychrotolerans]|uniref:NAD(P)-dependent oxidoreductase n=1 Tax=Mucilaginibacter psychrotolerans TaxID=1524096 RepID=A0A4Y8S9G7_9SPHI|nr:NAD(P)-dependent oxidoreductase [Mucilaginibacter psychrotolerans]TFF35532.1 NAD(P)-dependent oxidoreductase [Mucilaginibacter psychrotolerans]
MDKVFITGISGFLGSNIAKVLLNNGHQIIANYREGSSKELCLEFGEHITWILQDEQDEWVDKVIAWSPSVIIHSAWLGVGHQHRDSWEMQSLNIDYLQKILTIAGRSKAKQFIGLGSQGEYGVYDGCIDENYPLAPTEAYGRVKLVCAELVKQYAAQYGIAWYWLRLFSFFGKGEANNWLIPSLVKKILTESDMDLTAGEQKYSYLYVNDLGLAVNKIIAKGGTSGIYNISGKKIMALKDLVGNIRDKINPSFQLNFGKLPYRANQSMHLQGNSAKFVKTFGEFDVSDFDASLSATIEYFTNKFKEQLNEGI